MLGAAGGLGLLREPVRNCTHVSGDKLLQQIGQIDHRLTLHHDLDLSGQIDS